MSNKEKANKYIETEWLTVSGTGVGDKDWR